MGIEKVKLYYYYWGFNKNKRRIVHFKLFDLDYLEIFKGLTGLLKNFYVSFEVFFLFLFFENLCPHVAKSLIFQYDV